MTKLEIKINIGADVTDATIFNHESWEYAEANGFDYQPMKISAKTEKLAGLLKSVEIIAIEAMEPVQ